ncbi:Inner spore coat protein H [Rubripirellula obstinata]|uniref:Inner spore coat protein H n=1 Tax=Rubripirellula obstinata TaxID=406547 RepID=A0A5B1CD92_9BACT|nr:DUF4347 domain-containing protein [Rubripirellula obstinata]KAA1258536.1 Inner spore coat protein H [Rubripirellula obstinata]
MKSFGSLLSHHSQQNKPRNTAKRWDLTTLEKRVMLAADCGVAVAEAGTTPALFAPTSMQAEGTSAARTTASGIVFIDAGVTDIATLTQGIEQGHELVLLQPDQSGLSQINQVLSQRHGVSSVHIVAHGKAGQLQLGNQILDLDSVNRFQADIGRWSNALTDQADILIYGCDTGAGNEGLQLIERLAELTGADVAASTDRTGAADLNADWDLERHVGVIEAGLAFNATSRNAYRNHLPITIRAAGTIAQTQMSLQVDETTVATFDDVGLDFQDYTVDLDGINADQIRVVFTNDLYDPANDIDRNLIVDRITVDGLVYETEAPEVFSTGTWLSADGIVPGFRQSETLHTNGYFQFAGSNPPVGDGDPSGLVINEIHYNPGPDGVVDGDAEFIELYNSGDQAVDLGGLSFTGFNLTFAAGTTIGGGEYAIVSPSISLAESTWGVTPIAEFESGGISGGGELIQLIAADGVTVIDEVSYLDEAPWTPLPDGNGPSLELRDWALDNSLAENWSASEGDPTPAAENSIFGVEAPAPVTDIVVAPGEVLPGQEFTISANIEGATSANLVYRVMFGEEQTIAMSNLGDDTWQATLPGADAGSLIRYRIESDVAVAPFNDTINYFGLVVSPTDVQGNELPLFQFFVDEDEFTELTTTDLALTNTKIAAVVYYDGRVIDNATVRVRGGDFSRTNFAKKSLKFELPDGQTIDVGDEGSYPIDEFGINADFGDWSVATPDVTWDVFNAETDSFTTSFFVRAEINGDFHGVFRFQELYDGAWRDANGIGDDDEFYKAGGGGFGFNANFDKKSPDDGDFTLIDELNDVVTAPPSDAKTAYLYNNVDVANVVNHMALSTLVRHDDQEVQNFYMKRSGDTGLWSIVEWDLDRLWIESGDETPGPFTTTESINQELLTSVWEVAEFRDMYWRRMQTLVDTYLTEDARADFIATYDQRVNEIGATNSALEFAKWERNDIFANDFWRNELVVALDQRAAAYEAETRMPGSFSGSADIVISELHYNPLDGDAEFLELYNRSQTESIDLSGWTVDGVDLTIGFGTVILPGQTIVFTDDLPQFVAQSPGNIFIGGQYSGGLSGGGERITLSDADGNLIDEVEYDDSDPWPSEPDGDGFTLSLIDPSLDNSLASSWIASSQINGTPGVVQNSQPPQSVLTVFAAGSTSNEIITVEVAGQQVAVFDMASFGGQPGDLAARNFVELTWSSDETIDVSDVRINFINDTYDPDNGIDFNVAIDRIEIDGQVYETEADDVFSTGTYLAADGIVPGFRQSEILHADGYFQYASDIVIEPPTLLADGNRIQLFNFEFNSYLSSIGSDAETSTANNLRTQWDLIEVAGGDFKLLNADSGRYLDGDRSGIDTSSRSFATGTDWRFIDQGDGLFYLFNPFHDEYVDANGVSTDVAWDPGALNPDDLWRVILV